MEENKTQCDELKKEILKVFNIAKSETLDRANYDSRERIDRSNVYYRYLKLNIMNYNFLKCGKIKKSDIKSDFINPAPRNLEIRIGCDNHPSDVKYFNNDHPQAKEDHSFRYHKQPPGSTELSS